MKKIISIEHCFAIYADTKLPRGIDPITESEQRRPFYYGFNACLHAVDALAEISELDENEGDKAWQRFHAEIERFAQADSEGEYTIHH